MKNNSIKIISAQAVVAIMLLLISTPVCAKGILEVGDNLPIAKFNVYGSVMDRGLLAAETGNGVFVSWRFFPQEAVGVTNSGRIGTRGGLTGAGFDVFRNGIKINGQLITGSTNFLDHDGKEGDVYTVLTVVNGRYVSKTEPVPAAPRLTAGFSGNAPQQAGYISIPVQRPPDAILPDNWQPTGTQTQVYRMDHIAVGDVDGCGQMEFVVKWESAAPDVIHQGFTAPVIWDCYKQDGTLLWRIDLGINFRGGQHYGTGMLHDYDGDGKADFMVKTAPGSRVMEVVDGVLTGNYKYIGQKFIDESHPDYTPTVVTRWDGSRGWKYDDDYRTRDGNTTPASRLIPNTTLNWMSDFFFNMKSHPDYTSAKWGSNLQNDEFQNRGGYGWWKYPPQVMMGMYPSGYQGDERNIMMGNAQHTDANGVTQIAGRHWDSFVPNEQVLEWNQQKWQLLKSMPTDPQVFRDSFVMTREHADALALLWLVNNWIDAAGRDRFRGSGHIFEGPEFYSVFNGTTGAEMDTVEYAVPRGIVDNGRYFPDIGLLWNDLTGGWDEPYNRVNRHIGGVAYLGGSGNNPSVYEVRGYYSRMTVTRYDWDGAVLTGKVIVDSGFEVLPNPFASYFNVVGGVVTYSNFHAGPGRKEKVFNKDNPRSEIRPNLSGKELLDWMNKNGSITVQGFHSPSAMDVDGDGRDEIIVGSACFKGDGEVVYAGYYQEYTGTSLVPNGRIQKLGHGDALHVGYFDPDQRIPKFWSCLEANIASEVLKNARTGEVIYHTQNGNNTSWSGNVVDTPRAMVGKFTSEEGWQLFVRGRTSTPLEPDNGASGLRKSDGTQSAYDITPPTDFSIFWSPDLYTQTCNRNIAPAYTGIGIPLSTSGNVVQGGSKNRPAYVGDIFGDYREELVLGTEDASEIRIYFNAQVSTHKLATLQSDRRYRVELERQKSCYGQSVYPGFYYGADMDLSVYFDYLSKLPL